MNHQESADIEKAKRTKRMVLYISYDSPFVNKIEELQRKYPEEVFNIQGISNRARDINEFSKKFFSKSAHSTVDISVDKNANVSAKTVSQYTVENNKANLRMNGLYMLWKWSKKGEIANGKSEEEAILIADSLIESVVSGELFVNDLASVEKPYCWAQSLENLTFGGMPFAGERVKIKAPKRIDSFIHLVIQSMAYISNQLAGAIAFPDLFVYWDWFNRKEYGEDYLSSMNTKVKIQNDFQHFIYSCNFEFRTGDSPFTNVSVMDTVFLEHLFGDKRYPDFTPVDIVSVRELGKFFFEYFNSINMKEGVFTFPVVTLACSVKNGEPQDKDFVDWVCKTNCEKSVANVYTGDPTSLSSCCRLRSDTSKMSDYQNSFGVSGVSIGSHRVVGLNLPRLFVDSVCDGELDKKKFMSILHDRLQSCKKLLDAHRALIRYHASIGVLPLYNHDWISLDRQYSTIGLIGVYEMQHYFNESIGQEDVCKNISNYSFALDVLGLISNITSEWSAVGIPKYNLEQIPGESLAARLAEVDAALGKNSEFKIYSNQYVPLVKNSISISDRFKIQGKFDSHTSGGSILHINVDESEPVTPAQYKKLFDIAVKTRTVYWSVNYVYVKCSEGHFFIGNNDTEECPVCGNTKLSYFSRVVGFITDVKNWVEVRRSWEFPNRKFYSGKNI